MCEYFPSFLQLYGTITDCERQKLEQERRHTKHVQQVVTDCGRRIDQMERDCASQISTSVCSGGLRELGTEKGKRRGGGGGTMHVARGLNFF